MIRDKGQGWPPSNLDSVLTEINDAARIFLERDAMTDKHPLSDELRTLAEGHGRYMPAQVYDILRRAADALDGMKRVKDEMRDERDEAEQKEAKAWAQLAEARAERDSLKTKIACLKEQREAARRVYVQMRDERDSLKARLEQVREVLP